MTSASLGGLALHHTGVVVEDLDDAEAKYRALGLASGERISVPAQGVEAIIYPTGEERYLELISPTDAEGAIAAYMQKRGEGMHHVAYQADDIAAAHERDNIILFEFDLIDRRNGESAKQQQHCCYCIPGSFACTRKKPDRFVL